MARNRPSLNPVSWARFTWATFVRGVRKLRNDPPTLSDLAEDARTLPAFTRVVLRNGTRKAWNWLTFWRPE